MCKIKGVCLPGSNNCSGNPPIIRFCIAAYMYAIQSDIWGEQPKLLKAKVEGKHHSQIVHAWGCLSWGPQSCTFTELSRGVV